MASLEIDIKPERLSDAEAIERLHERAFGPGRFARTAFRIREQAAHDPALSFVARVGTLVVGSVRLTPVAIGSSPALLLGPLTVEPAFKGRGIGRQLIEQSIETAAAKGWRLVVLVGDAEYYQASGFKRAPRGTIRMPGPVDQSRVLYRELAPDALVEGDVRGAPG